MQLNIKITDTICSNCTKNSNEKDLTLSDFQTSIQLQDSYFLNILSSTETSDTCNVIIQNRKDYIIRKLLYDIETSILLPSQNSMTHITSIIPKKNK